MATIIAVSLDQINSAFGTTVKSPVDIANNIKSYASSNGDTLDTSQMVVSALGTLETFTSAVAKYKTSIPGIGFTLTSLELNRLQALDDIKQFGQIQNSTLNSIFADVSSLTTNAGLAAKNPYLVGLGLTASIGFSTAAFLSEDGDTSMANGILEFASDTYNTYNQVTDSLSDSKTEFLDTVDYLYSASGLIQEQYQDYISDSSSNLEFPTLAGWLKDNNTAIKMDSDDIVQYLDTLGVEKVSIDNQTYTIQNGDTLSQIAQDNNTTVDKLIEDNPWLTEDNRISSDGSYALIKSGEKLNLTVDNKTTSYGIDDTNTLTPEYQIDLTTQDVIPLQSGQTISHIAAKLDGINSIDLLEYNGLTLEQAKSLLIGFDVKIPKDVSIIQGEKAPIKVFENHDGTKSAIIKDENNNTIKVDNVEISSDKTQMSYTFEDATHILKKSSTGLMYESEVSTENITVQYDSPNIDGNKVVSNIDIKADTTFEEVSSLTQYTKEELKEFNLYDDTISAGSNISTPLSKDILDGGYKDITHYTTNDGENIFIVPNEDGTSTTYGTFTDGFANKASYEKNKNASMNIAFTNIDDNNLLLNTLFCLTSSLQRENLYSLSLLSSHKILSSSLELEKNKVSNNEFYRRNVE